MHRPHDDLLTYETRHKAAFALSEHIPKMHAETERLDSEIKRINVEKKRISIQIQQVIAERDLLLSLIDGQRQLATAESLGWKAWRV